MDIRTRLEEIIEKTPGGNPKMIDLIKLMCLEDYELDTKQIRQHSILESQTIKMEVGELEPENILTESSEEESDENTHQFKPQIRTNREYGSGSNSNKRPKPEPDVKNHDKTGKGYEKLYPKGLGNSSRDLLDIDCVDTNDRQKLIENWASEISLVIKTKRIHTQMQTRF